MMQSIAIIKNIKFIMVVSIGVDTIDVARFSNWYHYKRKTLKRIFSDHEIDYCMQNEHTSAQRFAVRFAAREALYKAFATYTDQVPPFLTLCSAVSLQHTLQKHPYIIVNWKCFPAIKPVTIFVSLTHTRTSATAFIILQHKYAGTNEITQIE